MADSFHQNHITYREFDLFRQVEDERDRRYSERFAAQERALDKAQKAQEEYDKHHNNLVAETVTKNTYSSKIADIDGKIDRADNSIHEINRILSATSGGVMRGVTDQTRQQWVTATVIGVVVFIFSASCNGIGLLITLYLNFVK